VRASFEYFYPNLSARKQRLLNNALLRRLFTCDANNWRRRANGILSLRSFVGEAFCVRPDACSCLLRFSSHPRARAAHWEITPRSLARGIFRLFTIVVESWSLVINSFRSWAKRIHTSSGFAERLSCFNLTKRKRRVMSESKTERLKQLPKLLVKWIFWILICSLERELKDGDIRMSALCAPSLHKSVKKRVHRSDFKCRPVLICISKCEESASDNFGS
jgi:hypothetical protein